MAQKWDYREGKWAEEIFPGIYRIGGDIDDTGGNQGILIDKDGHTYLIFTDGFDHGSWLGEKFELTTREREVAMNWEDTSYGLKEWLMAIQGKR